MPMFISIRAGSRRLFNLPIPKSTTERSIRRKSFSPLFPSLLLRVRSFPSLHQKLIFCPSLCGILLLSSEIDMKEVLVCPIIYSTFFKGKYCIIDLCVFSTSKEETLNKYVLNSI